MASQRSTTLTVILQNLVSPKAKEIAKDFGGIEKALGLVTKAAGALGVGLSAGAFGVGIKKAIDQADELNKLAQRVGLSVETLSALKFGADFGGASLEQMTTGLVHLNVALVEAAENVKGPAAAAFRQLGVQVVDSNGKMISGEEAIRRVADGISRMNDSAVKTNLAREIFGKGGVSLIPLLNAGAEGIEKMARSAELLGVNLDTKTAEAAEKTNDQLELLKKSIEGLFLQFAKILTGNDAATIGDVFEFMARQIILFRLTIEQASESVDRFVHKHQSFLTGAIAGASGAVAGGLPGAFLPNTTITPWDAQQMQESRERSAAIAEKIALLRSGVELIPPRLKPLTDPDTNQENTVKEAVKAMDDKLKGWIAFDKAVGDSRKVQAEIEQKLAQSAADRFKAGSGASVARGSITQEFAINEQARLDQIALNAQQPVQQASLDAANSQLAKMVEQHEQLLALKRKQLELDNQVTPEHESRLLELATQILEKETEIKNIKAESATITTGVIAIEANQALALDDLHKRVSLLDQAGKSLAKTFATEVAGGFRSSFEGFISGAKSGKQAFADFIRTLLVQMATAIVTIAIAAFLMSLFTAGGSAAAGASGWAQAMGAMATGFASMGGFAAPTFPDGSGGPSGGGKKFNSSLGQSKIGSANKIIGSGGFAASTMAGSATAAKGSGAPQIIVVPVADTEQSERIVKGGRNELDRYMQERGYGGGGRV